LPPISVEAKAPKSKKQTKPQQPAPRTKAAPAPQQPVSAQRVQQDAPYATPVPVSTATRSDIETFGQLNTGDVLRSMPGTFTRESPNNSGIAVNIRGLEGSGRVNMMVDGVRQNFRFTTHEAQGLLYIDTALLAGIDIERGAVATTGGAGALVGSANFRTLGIDDMIRPGNSSGFISSTAWGSNNQGFSEMIGGAVRSGGVGIGGAFSHREPDDYRNGDGITVPFTSQDIKSGLVKAELGASPDNRLTMGGVFYNNDFFAQGVEQTIDSQIFTAKYHYKSPTNPLIDFKFNLAASSIEMNYLRSVAPPGGPPGAAGRIITDDGRGGDVSNVSRFNMGAVRVKAEYGVEYFHDDVGGKNTINPGSAAGVNGVGESSIAGAFSQTTWSYGLFDLITGLRYDHFTLNGTFTAAAGNPIGLPAGDYFLDRSQGRVDPKITLAANVTPWLQSYITYAETFRPPTVQETMLGGPHPSGASAIFYPNPFLEPEVAKGWELGANIKLNGLFSRGDAFRFKANYFNNDVENYITGIFTAFGQGIFVNVPGSSHLQGIELQGAYDTGQAFASLSYTYTDSDLPSQLNGLGAQSYLPTHILSLTGGLRFFDRKLTVGARGTFASDAFIGVLNATDPAHPFTAGYAIVDLYTTYKVSENVTLGANLNNLFDVGYTPALSSPPTVNCTLAGVTCNTGLGRTVLFTVKTSF
jgi:hemoglobin/transferrin/lactoferrin receptor protein